MRCTFSLSPTQNYVCERSKVTELACSIWLLSMLHSKLSHKSTMMLAADPQVMNTSACICRADLPCPSNCRECRSRSDGVTLAASWLQRSNKACTSIDAKHDSEQCSLILSSVYVHTHTYVLILLCVCVFQLYFLRPASDYSRPRFGPGGEGP